jgi:small GTP-binding protein
MTETQFETIKIVLLGESGVGKTSIISQFIDQTFQEDLQSSTGGTFSSKTFTYDNGKILKLEIWDTAGQERYRALTKMFYKDANAAILVYDITRKRSFEELQNYWFEQIKESAPQNIMLVVDANKCDLIQEEEVDEGAARDYSKGIGAIFCTTSAKSSVGINDLFIQIARKYTGFDDIQIKNEEEDYSNRSTQTDGKISKNGSMKISREKTFDKKDKKKKCC